MSTGGIDPTPALLELVSQCKAGINVEINPHKDSYMGVKKYLEDRSVNQMVDLPGTEDQDFTLDVYEAMIESGGDQIYGLL